MTRAGAAAACGLSALLLTHPVDAAPRRYSVDASESELLISVGKAGLFKFAGHGHQVLAKAFSGTVIADPDDLGSSSVSLSFDMSALEVSGKGEPAGDVPKVQEKMAGPEVLAVASHPTATFVSQRVNGQRTSNGQWKLQLTGDLTLRGETRSLTVPVTVELDDGQLTANAELELKQSDFGIEPVSAGGGTVKVRNTLELKCRIRAKAGQ